MPLVFAFDLYGTLLSTSSIQSALSSRLPEHAHALLPSLVSDWRAFQLSYTFRLTSASQFLPFDKVTLLALQHALALHSLSLPVSTQSEVIELYNHLSTFPDVVDGLKALARKDGVEMLVFSNGGKEMVRRAVGNAGLPALESVVSVEDVGKYKPARETYEHLVRETGKSREEIVLVSCNPFDIVGAAAAGLRTVWVDREGSGWKDRLGEPEVVVRDLKGIGEALGI